MSTLHLPLKGEYFHEIRSGRKRWEYRLATPYWRRRLVDREYDEIVLTLGYPAADDTRRRLHRPWRGFRRRRITHPHFGPESVKVYAIRVN